MRYQLVKYEGVGKTQKETVVGESNDLDALYDERDRLDTNPLSLTARRHGIRPILEVKAAAN